MTQDVIDLEEFAKAGKKPPKAPHYRIRIDKEQFTVDVPEMTGRQLLELAKKLPPEKFKIFQHLRGGETVRIELSQTVDFTTPAIERFKTLPIDSTDGLAEPRHEFRMPEADVVFLKRLGHRWETIVERNVKWLLIYSYSIPVGYSEAKVDIALRIDPDYPTVQIDMVYVAPAIARANGRGIANLSSLDLDGHKWQQWSRHRTGENPWRPGIDDLESHLLLVDHWFVHELTK